MGLKIMKTIFACGSFGEPYKITVSKSLLDEADTVQRTLKQLPWNGKFYLPVNVEPLIKDFKLNCNLIIDKKYINLCIEGPNGEWDSLLDTNIMEAPELHVTNTFMVLLPEYVLSLKPSDISLIDAWQQIFCKKE